MTADAEAICDRLRKSPHLAAAFVNAPARLSDRSSAEMETATTAFAKERALRLSACAAAYSVQVSRALRPANLFMIRRKAMSGCPRNLTWIVDQQHAEIRFSGGEVKNGQTLIVNVHGEDARILWEWDRVHRPELMKLRGIDSSPYLFPGTAAPRLRKTALNLPSGCMSVAAIMELWDLGDRQLGLGLTPHQCRHALATLMLAVRPGDFANVSSVLANTEKVARFAASSLLTLVEMVDADLGITFLPEMARGSALLKNTRVRLHEMGEKSYREIGLAWRKGSGRVEEFRELGEFICEQQA
jgi:hypothetical protein